MSLIDIIRQTRSGGVIAVGTADDAITALTGSSYHLVVFAGAEHGPPPQALRDKTGRTTKVFHAPLVDDARPIGVAELLVLNQAAEYVRQAFSKDRRVLITSAGGRNRACLIAALALEKKYGCGGKEAIREVRDRRVRGPQPALSNPHFIALLARIARKPNGVLRLDKEAA